MNSYSYRLGCFLVVVLLGACSKPLPDERQITLALEQMQQASEDKQLATLMKHFHDSFKGRHNLHKRDLQARIYFHFRTNPKVRVFVSNVDIQVKDTLAEVSCHLLLTGSQKQLPDRGRLYRIDSRWQKHADKWLLMGANWEDAVEELLR